MPLVSFIIPIFNNAHFLKKCLESILLQTIKDIEVICINDCSTDSSKDILESYASKDNRIKIINFLNNKGSGAARNAGINNATGDYLRMVDADDFIPHDSTEKLLNIATQYESDFVRGGFMKSHESKQTPLTKGGRYPNELIINASFETERKLWYFDQHTTYLYRSYLVKNKAKSKYNEEMRNGEDIVFLLHLVPYMKRVSLIPETVYFYRQHTLSLMRGSKNLQYYLNLFKLYEIEYKYLTPLGYREQVDHFLFYHFLVILPSIVLPTIPDNLDDKDAFVALNSLKNTIDKYELVNLCFSSRYSWQTEHTLPLLSKLIVVLLTAGHLEEALQTIKKFTKDNKRSRTQQKKISAMLNSTSWRITKPIRLLVDSFK